MRQKFTHQSRDFFGNFLPPLLRIRFSLSWHVIAYLVMHSLRRIISSSHSSRAMFYCRTTFTGRRRFAETWPSMFEQAALVLLSRMLFSLELWVCRVLIYGKHIQYNRVSCRRMNKMLRKTIFDFSHESLQPDNGAPFSTNSIDSKQCKPRSVLRLAFFSPMPVPSTPCFIRVRPSPILQVALIFRLRSEALKVRHRCGSPYIPGPWRVLVNMHISRTRRVQAIW